jgi:hypothetical protein
MIFIIALPASTVEILFNLIIIKIDPFLSLKRMFHLKVKPCVDRILLFVDDQLWNEMKCVDPDAPEKIFNGEMPENKTVTAVFLCYVLGESTMEIRNVLSRPIQTSVEKATIANAICINYYIPKADATDESQPPATAKFCLIDIPERLQLGLGLPPTFILTMAPKEQFKGDAELMRQYGFDLNADGCFVRTFEHLCAVNEDLANELGDENIKISLYAHSIIKEISE